MMQFQSFSMPQQGGKHFLEVKSMKIILFPLLAYNNLDEYSLRDFIASLSECSDWRIRNSSLSNSFPEKNVT